jgi:capsular exopolysaccharide synthesis family protein
MNNNPLDTQAEIVGSMPILQETINSLSLRDEDGALLKPQDLSAGLAVKGIPGTDVLRIAYKSDDPRVAASVVNRLMEIYLKENIQSNRAETAAAREFIASQLPRTEAAVEEADLALRRFREQNNIIALNEEATAAVNIISTLEQQIAQAQSQLVDATARVQELQARVGLDPRQAVTLASLNQSAGVQEVLAQYQEVQRQLTVEQTRYREGHPSIDNLQRRLTALESLLQERVAQVGGDQSVPIGSLQIGNLRQELIGDLVRAEAERLGAAGRLQALSSTQSIYRSRASSIPGLEQEQRELERKLQASLTTYEALLTRLQEIQVAENQNIGTARIISSASIPEDSVGLSSKLILAAGGLSGLLLAITAAFAIDLLDRSVKTVKESKEVFGYPVLGIIPALSAAEKNNLNPVRSEQLRPDVPGVAVRDLARSPVSEAYRMLQANLRFASSDKLLKTIVVTSSVSKEGKSAVSANLATAIAQGGQRVLLVDADMRSPVQHHIWKLPNLVGLSHVIVDRRSVRELAQEVMPNLYVLSAGVIPPNPVALLNSKRMTAVIAECTEHYDFVIFDTPSISGTADATMLGKMTDGMVLVVRPGVVDASKAIVAKEFLAQSAQNVLGMVVNGVNAKSEPDSYLYYSQSVPSGFYGSTLPDSSLIASFKDSE